MPRRKKRKRGRPPKPKIEKLILGKLRKYKPHHLKGMHDIWGDQWRYWDYFISKAEKLAQEYGFSKIETPILEEANLFKRGVGLTTDIVEKEMYIFKDKDGEEICLRPEATASVARAYVEHGMQTLPQPVKFYYYGPMFRREKPQAGRYRQLHQFGLEIIGTDSSISDAELIFYSHLLFKDLGLPVEIQINSIGCPLCRRDYKKELLKFLRKNKNKLCSDCKRRMKTNPLRVFDCKVESDQEILSQAPVIVDFLDKECHQHFSSMLEELDALEIAYLLNPKIVRGLDYYTRTVFEIFSKVELPKEDIKTKRKRVSSKKESNIYKEQERETQGSIALAGGGRYDHLIEILGGKKHTPAVGVAYGIERIVEELEKIEAKVPKVKPPKVFVAQIGGVPRRQALKIFELLRQAGLRPVHYLSKNSLKSQLEQANRLGAKLSLIIGHQEYLDKTIIIRDMESGSQDIVDQKKVVEEIKKRLK